MKQKLKKDDTVQVMSGKEKGKTGKIVDINFQSGRVYIAGVNMVQKAMKRRSQEEAGGIVSIEAPLAISNVQIVADGKPSRIGYKFEGKKKVRIAKKTGGEV